MKFLTCCLTFITLVMTSQAQGTILLSNIGNDPVIWFGDPAPGILEPGHSRKFFVQLATGIGELVGEPTPILRAGYFSAGPITLEGLTGTVTLHLAGHSGDYDWSYSAPFEVTLGGSGTPPSPPAELPWPEAGLYVGVLPEPSTYALGVLGAGLFVIIARRRKSASF